MDEGAKKRVFFFITQIFNGCCIPFRVETHIMSDPVEWQFSSDRGHVNMAVTATISLFGLAIIYLHTLVTGAPVTAAVAPHNN